VIGFAILGAYYRRQSAESLLNPTIVLIIAIAIAASALVLAMSAHRRLNSARRALLLLQGTHNGKTLLEAVAAYLEQVRSVEAQLDLQEQRQAELFALLGRSARNLAVVRYDAFEDMGGRLSFSAAILDDHGNGVVVTSINARAESRVYAKNIVSGSSEHNLSTEEQQAIADALGHKQPVRR